MRNRCKKGAPLDAPPVAWYDFSRSGAEGIALYATPGVSDLEAIPDRGNGTGEPIGSVAGWERSRNQPLTRLGTAQASKAQLKNLGYKFGI